MDGIESLCRSFDNETSAEKLACECRYLGKQVSLLDELVLVQYLAPSSRYGILIIIKIGLRSVFWIRDKILLLRCQAVHAQGQDTQHSKKRLKFHCRLNLEARTTLLRIKSKSGRERGESRTKTKVY